MNKGQPSQVPSDQGNDLTLAKRSPAQLPEAENVQGIQGSTLKKPSLEVKHANGGPAVEERRIGVHCVAGLGRAPFLVAIALVNNGCTPINAINLIRKNRPGAINLTQTNHILEYKGAKSHKKGS